MHQQVREACALLAYTRQDQPDMTPSVEDLAGALENLVRAAAERDPELADVVDEILGTEDSEE